MFQDNLFKYFRFLRKTTYDLSLSLQERYYRSRPTKHEVFVGEFIDFIICSFSIEYPNKGEVSKVWNNKEIIK